MLQRGRALATVVLSVDPTLLYLLRRDPKHPAVVWKRLADQFQKKTLTNKWALQRRMCNLKLKDGQSMQKHVKMLTEIFDELSIISVPLDEENQVVHLLANLTEFYEMLVIGLEASPEVPKLEIVTEKSSTIEVNAVTSKHQTSREGPKCHHCGRFGHIKRKCQMLLESPGKNQDNRIKSYSNKRSLRKQKAYAAEEDTDDEGVEIIGLVTGHALSANRRSNWVVPSGATCHICNNEELFHQMIGLETPQELTVDDGHFVQATCQGDVILRMNMPNGKTRKCKLSDVLHVPDV